MADSDIKYFEEEMAVSLSESNPRKPSRDEIIAAMDKVVIPNRERYLNDLDGSVRFISGIKVLKEGRFNRVNYPQNVIEEGAPTWLSHERRGMSRKVNLDHTKSVKDRCGHITNSYSEDGWLKQDFLILRVKADDDAVDYYDAGLLDDVSVRMRVAVDTKHSQGEPEAKRISGLSTDFVDNPACKTCGLDAILEELGEKKEDKGKKTTRHVFRAVFETIYNPQIKELDISNEGDHEKLSEILGVELKDEDLSPDEDWGVGLGEAIVRKLISEKLGVDADNNEAIVTMAYKKGYVKACAVKNMGYDPDDIELEEDMMSDEQKKIELNEDEQSLFDKFKTLLGLDKEEDEEEELDEQEEELCGGSKTGGGSKSKKATLKEECKAGNADACDALKKLEDEEEETSDLEDDTMKTIEARLDTIESKNKELADENTSIKAENAVLKEFMEKTKENEEKKLHDDLVADVHKYAVLSQKELAPSIEDLSEKEDAELKGMLVGFQAAAKLIPHGQSPVTKDPVSLEMDSHDETALTEAQEKVKSLEKAMLKKSPNLAESE